jgi:hypothetical protein
MSEETNESIDLLKQMMSNFAPKDTETEKADMAIKLADSLMGDFNDILTQATFDMLLRSQTPEVQAAIRGELYNTWKARSTEELNAVGTDSGLSSMLGVDEKEVAEKAFIIADVNIRDYLSIDGE